MGGHGAHHGNTNNIKQTDEEVLGMVQTIETIKHCPNTFHLEFFNFQNMYMILGGMNTMVMGGFGGLISYSYYQALAPKNFYHATQFGMHRVALGFLLGTAVGFHKFGDRQKLQNAWVAERLRRRYPDSMKLSVPQGDLWMFKGVHAPHDFYKWV